MTFIALLFVCVLLFFVKKRPEMVFICCFVFPVINLPFYILLDYEMGLLNIAVEVLCLFSLLVITVRSTDKVPFKYFFPVFLILIFLISIGLVLGLLSRSVVVVLLGLKLLILPFFLALVARFQGRFIFRFVNTIMIVQIINALASVLETLAGVQKLQSLGFEYGTNLRNFDSVLRAPGLSLTNYILGSFSAAVLVLVYLLVTKEFRCESIFSKTYLIFSGLCSIICLALSNFRSGFVFAALSITLCELFLRRRIQNFIVLVLIAASSVLFAYLIEFFLLNNDSSVQRRVKWIELLSNHDWKLGSGLGYTGAASLSSFSSVESAVVTDNQYVTMLLQYGIIGLMLTLLILLYLFTVGSIVSKCLIASLSAMMMFVEVWDYTIFFSLVLFLIYTGFNSKISRY